MLTGIPEIAPELAGILTFIRPSRKTEVRSGLVVVAAERIDHRWSIRSRWEHWRHIQGTAPA